MGLFDGISLKGIIRDVSKVAGAFTGAQPVQEGYAVDTNVIWEQPPKPVENQSTGFFDSWTGVLQTLPVFNQTPATDVVYSIPQETKVSGQMENGPQVYQGAAGALVPFAQQALGQLGRTIFGGGVGSGIVGGVGGALIGQGVSQMMGGDSCGCAPKAFVRLDKCGRPIITRAMQQKAKDLTMCMGIEGAAAALGIPVPLLAEIAFKRFKPRARGISGAQLKTAQRVNNKVMHMAKKLEASCRRPAARRAR